MLFWSPFQRWLSALLTHNNGVVGTGTPTSAVGPVISTVADSLLDRGSHIQMPTDAHQETITAHGANGADGLGSVRINGVTLFPVRGENMAVLPPDYAPTPRISIQLVYEIGVALQQSLVRKRRFFRNMKTDLELEFLWLQAVDDIKHQYPNAHINWEFDPDYDSGDRAHASGNPSEPTSEGS